MKTTDLTLEQRIANSLAALPNPESMSAGETRNKVVQAISILREALAAAALRRVA